MKRQIATYLSLVCLATLTACGTKPPEVPAPQPGLTDLLPQMQFTGQSMERKMTLPECEGRPGVVLSTWKEQGKPDQKMSAAEAPTSVSATVCDGAPAQRGIVLGKRVDTHLLRDECPGSSATEISIWEEQGTPNQIVDAVESASLQKAIICDGKPGAKGETGEGLGFSIDPFTVSAATGNVNCHRLSIWKDVIANGSMDPSEAISLKQANICGGAPGYRGAKGEPGLNGYPGSNGKNGIDGKDGKDGRDMTLTTLQNVTLTSPGAITPDHFPMSCVGTLLSNADLFAQGSPFKVRASLFINGEAVETIEMPAENATDASDRSKVKVAFTKSENAGWTAAGNSVGCGLQIVSFQTVHASTQSAVQKVETPAVRKLTTKDLSVRSFHRDFSDSRKAILELSLSKVVYGLSFVKTGKCKVGVARDSSNEKFDFYEGDLSKAGFGNFQFMMPHPSIQNGLLPEFVYVTCEGDSLYDSYGENFSFPTYALRVGTELHVTPQNGPTFEAIYHRADDAKTVFNVDYKFAGIAAGCKARIVATGVNGKTKEVIKSFTVRNTNPGVQTETFSVLELFLAEKSELGGEITGISYQDRCTGNWNASLPNEWGTAHTAYPNR